MMTLIIGGSGSGKSAYAEDLIVTRFPEVEKYYIATMEPYDDDAMRRVQKHRTMRKDKGFTTVERPRDVAGIAEKGQVALLECLSNLVANEMFVLDVTGDYVCRAAEVVAEKVLADIAVLHEKFSELYIVSNNVFEDGSDVSAGMRAYLDALAIIQNELANRADQVIEVVVGIPLAVKTCI